MQSRCLRGPATQEPKEHVFYHGSKLVVPTLRHTRPRPARSPRVAVSRAQQPDDDDVSPYNVLVGPAQISGQISNDEARGVYRYLSENGKAYVRRGNNGRSKKFSWGTNG